MHPVLIDFGRFKLHSYGLMLFIAFLLGIYIAQRRAKSAKLGEATILDLSTLMILSGLIGSRVMYVFTHLEEFRGRWWDIINPVQSNGQIGFAGLVLLGGVLLGIVVVGIYVWRKRLNLLTVLDVFTPSLALGIGIGRMGCFLNGCCFGLPTDLPWGMVFPHGTPAGSVFPGVHVHPTQLYAFLYEVSLFFTLLWAEKRFRTYNGFTFSRFLIGYGILRFVNELIRWHEEGLRFIHFANGGFITVSQIISLTMIATGIVLFLLLHKKQSIPNAGEGVQSGSKS